MQDENISVKSSQSEAQPFLRYKIEKMIGNVTSADSDSAACAGGGESGCGTGASSCAHVPEQPKVQP